VRYLYEPLNQSWMPRLRGQLPHFTYLPADGVAAPLLEKVAGDAFRGLQSGKQLLRAAYRGYWRAATRRADRVIVKDPTACLLSDWVAAKFGATVVVLLRHPCGFASSMASLGWTMQVGSLLRQPQLMRDHLGEYEDLLLRCRSDRWLTLGAMWGALHRVLWRQGQGRDDWHFVRYEDLCADPVAGYASLGGSLGLDFDRTAAAAMSYEGARVSAHSASLRKDSRSMARIWEQRMSPAQVDAVMGIVEQFGLPLYS